MSPNSSNIHIHYPNLIDLASDLAACLSFEKLGQQVQLFCIFVQTTHTIAVE